MRTSLTVPFPGSQRSG